MRWKVRPLANSRNLPICVCASRKFDKKNGKICKIHEEKHKIDVKENEKVEKWGNLPPQNRGCGAKNRGCGAKNRGFGHSPKGRIPCGCTSLNPTKSTTKKVDENRIYYPFWTVITTKTAAVPIHFNIYIYTTREKWYKVLIIRGMREKWRQKSGPHPLFCFLPGILAWWKKTLWLLRDTKLSSQN